MADERDDIRSRINIVDLVGQSVLLTKKGKSWKGLCPFHADKNPSFTVDPTLGSYKCWSCGEHGDIFTWVMKTRHVEFVEALRILAEQAGVTLSSRGPTVTKSDKTRWHAAMQDALAFFRDQLTRNEEAIAYCNRRGLSGEVLETWEIGYAPDVRDALAGYLKRKGHSLSECKDLFLVDQDSAGGFFDKFWGRLIFPIRAENGDLVAFGGRLLGDGHPKYINSGDTPLYRKSRVLYGMHRAKDTLAKAKRAVLVEGYLDVIACHAAGVTGAVASLGTALSEDHARLLKRWCEQVVILYDSDAAGQKAADRAIEIIREAGLKTRVALMPPGEDPDTLLRNAGPAAVQQAVETGLRPLDYKIQKIKASLSPDQEEFWSAVKEALATATNDMEEERYIAELAALYPGATDIVRMQRALKDDVRKIRRNRKASRTDDEVAPSPSQTLTRAELHVSEIAILRGLLEPGMRQLAWNVCGEQNLFVTETGRLVAYAVTKAFPTGPPVEKPAVWVPRIEPESVRDAFDIAQNDPRVDRLTPDFLTDAIERLRKLYRNREIREQMRGRSKDVETLRDIHEKFKKRHESDNSDAS